MDNGETNSGGTKWKKKEEFENKNSETINFIKLDTLVKNKTINHPIGIIHLDVEGMEENAIKGGKETINKYKPYISLECHENNPSKFTKLLQNYEFNERINSNNTFSPINR